VDPSRIEIHQEQNKVFVSTQVIKSLNDNYSLGLLLYSALIILYFFIEKSSLYLSCLDIRFKTVFSSVEVL
jgi:hypothetical protein